MIQFEKFLSIKKMAVMRLGAVSWNWPVVDQTLIRAERFSAEASGSCSDCKLSSFFTGRLIARDWAAAVTISVEIFFSDRDFGGRVEVISQTHNQTDSRTNSRTDSPADDLRPVEQGDFGRFSSPVQHRTQNDEAP